MFKPMHATVADGVTAVAVALVDDEDQPAPSHARSGANEAPRTTRTIPTARVNLMPPEVLLGRRVRRVKKRMAVAVVVVLVGTVGALGWSKFDESRATAGLDAEQAAVDALKQEQLSYAELLRIDTVTRDIDRSLTTVMGDDVAWDQYLASLAASAPADVILTGVTVELTDLGEIPAGTAVSGSGSLDGSGQEHIGSLTVSGLATSHKVVAAWASSLTDVEGFLVPYILGSTALVDGVGAIAFTIEITLSSTVRSLRYEPAAGTTTDGQGG